jgi:FkbM family methyltransferase
MSNGVCGTPSGVTSGVLRRQAALATGAVGRRYHYSGQRVFSLAARALRRFSPPGEIDYLDADGYRRVADLRDHMESLVFVGRHRLPGPVIAAVRPGDWVVDVGASVGSVAGQLCRAVGAQGAVWAFEPIPRNVARLRRLAEVNGLGQLHVFDCALSSANGTATIGLAGPGGSGYASFTASWISAGRLDVRVERLDDLVASVDEPRPLRLVKLDVEGYERHVLEGAAGTLRVHRPLVYCEFNDVILRDAGSSSVELLATFDDLGYGVAPAWRRTAEDLTGRNVDLLLTPIGG